MIDLEQKNAIVSCNRNDVDFELSHKDNSEMYHRTYTRQSQTKRRKGNNPSKKDDNHIYYESEDASNLSLLIAKPLKRGPYRKYSQKLKEDAVNMALNLDDPNKAANVYQIPVKNLRRWIRLGTEKRKGYITRREKNKRPQNGNSVEELDH